MAEMLVLRLVHIVCGAFWVGAIFLMVVFLGPVAAAAGPEGGRFMGRLMRSKLVIVMPTLAILTILSGLRMYQRLLGESTAWMSSGPGMTLGIGSLAAILAFVIGMTVTRPTSIRMGALALQLESAGSPATEAQRATLESLRGRATWSTRLIAALLGVALVAMSIARYIH